MKNKGIIFKFTRVLSFFILVLFLMLLSACKKDNLEKSNKSEETAVNQETSGQETDKKEPAVQEDGDKERKQEPEDTGTEPKVTQKLVIGWTGPQEELAADAGTKKTGENIKQEIRDISSAELVKEIKIGWNLGNTMDATGSSSVSAEMSWGNPFTTQDMIDAVKDAGFNTLRIPVTWQNHFGKAPDYQIDDAWLDRVQDITDYAVNNDMFVIINMHHEDWHFPSYDNYETARDMLTKIWAQIADRFQNYDEHLIFEGLNEPRLKGTPYEWTGGSEESRDVINKLNAAFVDTIRKAGGNNPLRHLMIPTYAASSDPKTWQDFTIPEDDKIIVSIHAYTPYNFALNKKGTSAWSSSNANDTRDIDNLMSNLYNYFISKGKPVIIGEFGAMNKNNIEARADWAQYYVKKAKEQEIPCIWWDNNAFAGTGELFGLFDRRNLIWQYPEIIDALMKGIE